MKTTQNTAIQNGLNQIRSISPQRLHELSQAGHTIDLIDVRTPAEFREVHASISRLVPLDSLDPRAMVATRKDVNEPLYLICRSGGRSQKACEAFVAAGLADQIVNVEGGTLAWEKAGLPVVRGKKTIGLERQVRIAAGTLVFIGTVLGVSINQWFHVIPGFVGAGLIFAGVTDTCGMAMLLAKMPWNRV